jgi:predicted O-methyltransferase YrrM
MIKSHNEIFGWFDFSDIYDEAVNKASDGDSMLEIGCYMGKSTAYLCERIKLSGKKIDLHVVDLFDTSSIFQSELYNGIIKGEHTLEQIFDINMEQLGFKPTKYKGLSNQMPTKFKDDFFSMIFIDGSHDYKSVIEDMELYYPKLKSGGIFAGHDYTQRDIGVIQAVNEFTQKHNLQYQVRNTSWFTIKPF